METPAWILVLIIVQGQNIAEKADDIVDNVRDMTTIGGLVKHFTENYINKSDKKKKAKKEEK